MREEKRYRNLTCGTASKAGQPVIERLPDSRRKYSPQDGTELAACEEMGKTLTQAFFLRPDMHPN
jgi:hypothetical protein